MFPSRKFIAYWYKNKRRRACGKTRGGGEPLIHITTTAGLHHRPVIIRDFNMFNKTVLARALSIAFAASVGSIVVVSGSAHAASNSAGDIVGRAAAGTVITIENKSIASRAA